MLHVVERKRHLPKTREVSMGWRDCIPLYHLTATPYHRSNNHIRTTLLLLIYIYITGSRALARIRPCAVELPDDSKNLQQKFELFFLCFFCEKINPNNYVTGQNNLSLFSSTTPPHMACTCWSCSFRGHPFFLFFFFSLCPVHFVLFVFVLISYPVTERSAKWNVLCKETA